MQFFVGWVPDLPMPSCSWWIVLSAPYKVLGRVFSGNVWRQAGQGQAGPSAPWEGKGVVTIQPFHPGILWSCKVLEMLSVFLVDGNCLGLSSLLTQAIPFPHYDSELCRLQTRGELSALAPLAAGAFALR